MTPKLKPYDRVRLVSNRFAPVGAPVGTIGYVIERHTNGALEVEVSNRDGSTRAQFVAKASDLALAPEEKRPSGVT